MQLTEKYRPSQWSDVVGQDKVLAKLDILRPRGFGGRAFWISGQSGTGKTTIARLIAAEVADDFNVEECDAQWLTAARIDQLERDSRTLGMGCKTGRAIIVNESHGLKASAIRQLLVWLERLPAHVVIVFTTTCDGQDKLFEDMDDTAPLLSRCTRLELSRRDLAEAFARRASEIADKEGLNGQPIGAYVRLLQKHRNNLRAAIQDIESGVMLAKGGA